MAVGASTRKRCKPFHYSARTVSQCRTGNRRRRTVPATEPNRAAVEIALPCTCATERRAADAILSTSSRPHAENIVRSNIVTVRMAAHVGPRIELCACRIIMIAIPTFLRSPRGFICEWMRERFFVFGSPHVILLPALSYYLRFPLFESCEKPIPANRPFSKFIFKFLIGFQHTKFAAEHLKHTPLNWKEYADGISDRELDRACSRKAPVHREC